jgi:hypothetical protein
VKVNQATHSVGMMCRLLGVSRSGFYAAVDRPMSARGRRDLELTGKIGAIHRRSRETRGDLKKRTFAYAKPAPRPAAIYME